MAGRPRTFTTEELDQRVTRAATAEFCEQGYDAARIDAIVLAAGVSKPVLYRTFGSKSELYCMLLERFAGQLATAALQAFNADTAGSSTKPLQLRSIIDSWFQVLAQHPEQWRLLTSANSADPAVRAAVQRVTDMQVRNDVMLINAFAPDLPTAEVAPLAHALRGSLIAIGTWWLDHPTVDRSVPVDAMTRLSAGLFASPLQRQRKQVPSVVTDS